MKKLLSMLVIFGFLFCANIADAKCPCPYKGKMMPCQKTFDKKMMECKKAEIAKELCLTVEQQDEADKIFEKKMKKMKRLHKKIRKYEERICETRQEKMEVKKESMEAFKEILTTEQKCKFEKIMQEHRAEMKKMMQSCKDCDCKCPDCPYKKQMEKCPKFDQKPCDCTKPCDCPKSFNKPCLRPCEKKKPCNGPCKLERPCK